MLRLLLGMWGYFGIGLGYVRGTLGYDDVTDDR